MSEFTIPYVGAPTEEQREVGQQSRQNQIYSAWYPSGSSEDGTFQINVDPPASSSGSVDTDMQKFLAASARSILRLMRVTRGRMRGHVFIRKRSSHPWQSAYCVLAKNGMLRKEHEDEEALLGTFVRDLRGCKVYATQLADSSPTPTLYIRSANAVDELQMKLSDMKYFEYWFAALLCWQSMNAKQSLHRENGKLRPTQITPAAREYVFVDQKLSTIQSSRALLVDELDSVLPNEAPSQIPANPEESSSSRQIEVQCTLRGDGKLVLQLPTGNQAPLVTLNLGKLPRSAIQQVKKGVFNKDNVVGIFPQYALSSEACSRVRPIFLCYETIESFEAWVVLLQAFAAQEMFCPQQFKIDASHARSQSITRSTPASLPSYLRTKLSLHVSVGKARFYPTEGLLSDSTDSRRHERTHSAQLRRSSRPATKYIAQVLVDEQVKATTSFSWEGTDPAWYERFNFPDLSSAVSTISFRIQQVDDQTTSSTTLRFCGQADILINELAESPEQERWWPVADKTGHIIGDISLKPHLSRENILAATEYDPLMKLLRKTRNRLTLKLWRQMPNELVTLVEHLLEIFQASGQAAEWLKDLVNDEVENSKPQSDKETSALEDDEAVPSNHDKSPALVPEDRKQGAAVSESSILFRGNTLLTKALDLHLKRIGGRYLDATIGEHVRRILREERDCEVDPSKATHASEEDLKRNWENLRSVTKDIWRSIYNSSSKCPSEVKEILQHIRSRAKFRFGNAAPNVIYSSVSGFLFLRFFCAALMNPHLFGLILSRPPRQAQRTFLLVAKSIQGLANLSSFGIKESWMSPMNEFYTTHRQEMMDFIDSICTLTDNVKPSIRDLRSDDSTNSSAYEAPLKIYKSLPPVAREGFLCLPHLIDRPRSLAALVELWMTYFEPSEPRSYEENAWSSPGGLNETVPASNQTVTLKTLTSILSDVGDDEDLATFHTLCLSLHRRTADIVDQAKIDAASAEAASETGSHGGSVASLAFLDAKWVKLAERIEAAPQDFHLARVPQPPPSPIVTSFFDNSSEPSPQTSHFKPGERERPSSRQPDRAASAQSNGKRRSLRRSGNAAGKGADRGGRRTSSPSLGSEAQSLTSAGGSPRTRKKKPPSPPARDAEENALRKLGWI